MPSGFKERLNPAHILILSFSVTILFGTGLLMLPYSIEGSPLTFIDALFMATSATCVTGLSLVDIGTKFTLLGQVVILALIQLGGLGIMTFSIIIVFFTGKHIPLRRKTILKDSFVQFSGKELFNIIKNVFLITFVIEGAGTIILFMRWKGDYPLMQAFYYSVFHAVSAFCNAGFSLYADSLLRYRSDIVIISTMSCLIILGGLGFFVLVEIKNSALNKRRTKIGKQFSLHTKIVMSSSAILFAIGAVAFFFLERDNSMKGMPIITKVLSSLFQSATIRTAGFTTVNFGALTTTFLFLTIILMFIGASPGSTGGGIKTTSVGMLFAMIKARLTARENASIFKRTISSEAIGKSISVIFASVFITILICSGLLISELGSLPLTESKGLFLDIVFEVISAFGTVGLSTGYTTKLTITGRVLITVMMLIGRLGPLTIAAAVSRRRAKGVFQYSEENVMIG